MARPAELDTVYTALADAVHASGPRSELFLAMLSLRLVARLQDAPAALAAIEQTLGELAAQDGNGPAQPSADAPHPITRSPP